MNACQSTHIETAVESCNWTVSLTVSIEVLVNTHTHTHTDTLTTMHVQVTRK